MTETDKLLPVDILDVESKPEEYDIQLIISGVPKKYNIKTESGMLVNYCIQKEHILHNYVLIKVPANTTKLYIYGRLER